MGQQEIPTTTLQKFRVAGVEGVVFLTGLDYNYVEIFVFCETQYMVVYQSFLLLCYWSMDQF